MKRTGQRRKNVRHRPDRLTWTGSSHLKREEDRRRFDAENGSREVSITSIIYKQYEGHTVQNAPFCELSNKTGGTGADLCPPGTQLAIPSLFPHCRNRSFLA